MHSLPTSHLETLRPCRINCAFACDHYLAVCRVVACAHTFCCVRCGYCAACTCAHDARKCKLETFISSCRPHTTQHRKQTPRDSSNVGRWLCGSSRSARTREQQIRVRFAGPNSHDSTQTLRQYFKKSIANTFIGNTAIMFCKKKKTLLKYYR